MAIPKLIRTSLGLFSCFLVVPLVGSTNVFANSLTSVSFEQALENALKAHPDLKIAQQEVTKAQANVDAVEGAFDPMLTLETSYTVSGPDTTSSFTPDKQEAFKGKISLLKTMEITGGKFSLSLLDDYTKSSYNTSSSSILSLLGDTNYYEGAVNLSYSQPFLKGFLSTYERLSRKTRNLRLASALALTQSKKDDLIGKVNTSYWNTYLSYKTVQKHEEALSRARLFYDLVKNRLHRGLAERIDLLQAEAAWRSQKNQLESSETSLKNATEELKILTGLEFEPSHLSSKPTVSRQNNVVLPEELVIKNVLKHRGNLKSSYFAMDAAEKNEEASKHNTLPTLNGIISYGSNEISDDFRTSLNQSLQINHPTWAVELQFALPLGNHAADAEYENARAEKIKSQSEVKKIQDQIIQEAKDTLKQVSSSLIKLEETEKLLNVQREKLKLAQQRYKQGRATSNLLIDFQNDLNMAELDLISKKVDYVKNFTKLELIQGKFGL